MLEFGGLDGDPSTLPQLYGLQNKVFNQAASDYVGGSASGIFTESNGNSGCWAANW